MDPRSRKLKVRFEVSREVAEELVRAGLDTVNKVKAAAPEDLEKIKGIGKATAERLRR